ncbi:hypothetical protein B0F90DRAFT_1672784, partial [Multifurca ochricompacta]
LRSWVKPNAVLESANPVKDKLGVVQYDTEGILRAMKEHYQDLLTYDPKGVSQDYAYWEDIDLGLPRRPDKLTGLNSPITWKEVLVTIRGMNRNTAPGKDGVHINVLKSMVLEECMRKLSLDNPNFKRPDFVRVDLPREELPYHPLTPMGNAFYTVLIRVWNSGVTPELWQEVHIINLFKGGDKQGGFCLHEEVIGQTIALAEIVQRHYLEGHPTFGTFIDFKKAYDRMYHAYLFCILDHIGVRGLFLENIKGNYIGTKYAANRKGILVRGVDIGPCRGLMYADDVVALNDSIEGVQAFINGMWTWGEQFGMELGHEKCGILLFNSNMKKLRRNRARD